MFNSGRACYDARRILRDVGRLLEQRVDAAR